MENTVFAFPPDDAAEDAEDSAVLAVVTPTRIEARLRQTLAEISGTDSGDTIYSSINELWEKEFSIVKKGSTSTASPSVVVTSPRWYDKGFSYWESEENCPLTDDGVLGGFGRLTPLDTRDSNAFLDKLMSFHRPSLVMNRAADCGAGIGRVSKNLLLPRCAHVDLVEQSPRLLLASGEYLGADASRTTRLNVGLQNFKPERNTYDLVWIQWVIGQLNDIDFVRFFRRCARGLTEHGIIVLKDNCSEDWTFTIDSDDSSVARCPEYMRVLFALSGLEIVHETTQQDFPRELCPVHMFALAPKSKK